MGPIGRPWRGRRRVRVGVSLYGAHLRRSGSSGILLPARHLSAFDPAPGRPFAEDADGGAPPPAAARRRAVRSAAVFVALALLAGIDAVGDWREGIPLWNVALDLALTGCALVAGVTYLAKLLNARRGARVLLRELGAARADAAQWQQQCGEVLPQLGAAIVRQFERWSLTPEEQEVALLVLGGLSTVQIAARLQRAEHEIVRRTSALYRKAGVSGPAALSAFFLRDLLFVAEQRLPPQRPAADPHGSH
jgi:DNA-binding CsgD family transcriptional regulator